MLSCPACDSTAWARRPSGGYQFRGTHYQRVRCLGCGLFGLDPIPEPTLLPAIYSDGYFEAYSVHGTNTQGYTAGWAEAQRHAANRLDVIARFTPRGRLLEVGCAGGHFLGVAARRGYDVVGVELNQSMAEHARAKYGVSVLCGDILDLELPGTFDVIHLEDVLEHLPAPREALVKLLRHLAPGGHLAVDGPLERQPTLALALLELNLLMRKPPDPERSPHHLWQFTLATQRRLLTRAGLRQIWARVYAGVAQPIPASSNRWANLRRDVANAANRLSVTLSPFLARVGIGDRALVVARALES